MNTGLSARQRLPVESGMLGAPDEVLNSGKECLAQGRNNAEASERNAEASEADLRATPRDGQSSVNVQEPSGGGRSGERGSTSGLGRVAPGAQNTEALLDAAADKWGEVEAEARRRLEVQVEQLQVEIEGLRAERAASPDDSNMRHQVPSCILFTTRHARLYRLLWPVHARF